MMAHNVDPVEVEEEVDPEHVRWSAFPVFERKVPIEITCHSQRLSRGADALEVGYPSSSGNLNPTGRFGRTGGEISCLSASNICLSCRS